MLLLVAGCGRIAFDPLAGGDGGTGDAMAVSRVAWVTPFYPTGGGQVLL